MRIINLFFAIILATQLLNAQSSYNVTLLDSWSNDTLKPSFAHLNTYNETWGFVQNGVEYGVIGSTWGTHIFDLSNPSNIVETGSFKGEYSDQGVVHRDYHDYKGYMYVVSDEGFGISKLRIVDLQYLPDSVSTVYMQDTLFSRSHNIFIDTAKAKLYTCGGENNPGVRVFSLANPIAPEEISSISLPQGSHDIFVRNDTAYINDGTSGLFIYDFSNAANPTLIGSLTSYPQQGYNHSGWLNSNGTIYAMGDETHGKDLKLLDVSDLSNINVLDTMSSQVDDPNSIPHNMMIKGNFLYVSYYFDGFVVYDISDPSNPYISGYYDTSTEVHANNVYRGCWGVYSFLPSGIILASDMQTGFYVFDVSEAIGIETQGQEVENIVIFPNPTSEKIILSVKDFEGTSFKVFNASGNMIANGKLSSTLTYFPTSELPAGAYVVEINTSNTVHTKKFIKTN